MKKIYLLLVVMSVLLAFSFTGCKGNEEGQQPEGNQATEEQKTEEKDTEEEKVVVEEKELAPGTNLEELFQKGMDSYSKKNIEPPVLFPETDIEYLENFYPGISYANIEQIYVAMAPVTNAPMEVALVELGDGTDIPAMRDIFQERIDARANDTTYPEESEVWKKNGKVTISGNFVFMAVMTDDYGIPEEFILE